MAGRIAYYGNIVTSGLVLNLDAAKRDSYPGSGTTWRDISGNGNNGTLTNGPTFNSDNYGSIVFDGVDDYTTGSLSSPTVGCISMWINSNSLIDASSTGKTIIQLRWNGVFDTEWYILVGGGTSLLTNEYITVVDTTGSNARTGVTDGGSLLANTWYNLVFNSESGKYQIYVNTVLKNISTFGGGVSTLTNGNRVSIAALVRTPEQANALFFDGKISNVQLYSNSLTTSQIQQNYNATKTRYGL